MTRLVKFDIAGDSLVIGESNYSLDTFREYIIFKFPFLAWRFRIGITTRSGTHVAHAGNTTVVSTCGRAMYDFDWQAIFDNVQMNLYVIASFLAHQKKRND